MGNILLVSNYPSDTGYAWWLMEHFWLTLGAYCIKRGGVAYLAYPRIKELPERIKQSPLNTVELTLPWTNLSEAVETKKFLRNKGIRYLYLTDQPYVKLQYISYRLCGVQSIIVHDHTPGDRPPTEGLWGTAKALRNRTPGVVADRVFTVSELMRQRSVLNGRIPENKCVVVQNGIEPVSCEPASDLEVRRELGVDSDAMLIIATGRVHPYKRFDFVIDVARVLRDRSPELNIVFVVAGDGPALSDLKAKVDGEGLSEHVRLLGFRRDVRRLLCASDVAIHAALGEAFSLSIAEYMSAGLSVLVPDIPSVSQAIEHEKNGFIYEANDPTSAAGFLRRLAEDASLRVRLGGAARRKANAEYSLERCTERLLSAFRLSLSE